MKFLYKITPAISRTLNLRPHTHRSTNSHLDTNRSVSTSRPISARISSVSPRLYRSGPRDAIFCSNQDAFDSSDSECGNKSISRTKQFPSISTGSSITRSQETNRTEANKKMVQKGIGHSAYLHYPSVHLTHESSEEQVMESAISQELHTIFRNKSSNSLTEANMNAPTSSQTPQEDGAIRCSPLINRFSPSIDRYSTKSDLLFSLPFFASSSALT